MSEYKDWKKVIMHEGGLYSLSDLYSKCNRLEAELETRENRHDALGLELAESERSVERLEADRLLQSKAWNSACDTVERLEAELMLRTEELRQEGITSDSYKEGLAYSIKLNDKMGKKVIRLEADGNRYRKLIETLKNAIVDADPIELGRLREEYI